MKDNFWDTVTSELKSKMKYVRSTVREDFIGTKPYRFVKQKPEESVADYMSLKPEQIPMMRENIPGFIEAEQKILKLMDRMKG